MNLPRLIIKNIGPIKEIDILLKKVNVFIGPQSSGKSTIAKVISFCSWLEKNKHDLGEDGPFTENVIDKLISYHRMEGYLSENSRILYQGDNLDFAYNWDKTDEISSDNTKNHRVNVSEKEVLYFKSARLSNPKVLYIPAERNFISVIPNLQKYDDTKDSLQSFIVDWFEAKRYFQKDKALNLIDLGMKYYSENDEDYIQIDTNKAIRLRNASSGLQSITPLLTVVDYMTKGIYEKERPFSVEEHDVLNKILHSLAIESMQTNDIKDLKRRLTGFLQGKVYSHTQFVIEEPEQNLYPQEQYKLIDHLVSIINHGKQHRLTLTTHSPYIINFLNVLLRRPENTSPSYINHKHLNVYLISDGLLTDLMMHDKNETKWAVDTSVLNAAMQNIAEEFERLLK